MIVAMSCNKNWYNYLVVDIYSMLKFSKNIKKIYLFVETDRINDIKYLDLVQKKFNIEIVLIDYNKICYKYLSYDSPNKGSVYSDFCFSRLILADYVIEDKILYLDTDAIVRNDISHLWDYDMSDYYVMGVRDYGVMDNNYLDSLNLSGRYINSGVVMFNLRKIREDNIVSKWFDIINTRKLLYPDQDALNIICTDYELYISSMYNFIDGVTLSVVNLKLTKIFHYAGPKTDWVCDRFFSEEWYDSEELFYNEIVNI